MTLTSVFFFSTTDCMSCGFPKSLVVLYLIVQHLKAGAYRNAKEYFTSPESDKHVLLTSLDGNISLMPMSHIYTSIKEAKEAAAADAMSQARPVIAAAQLQAFNDVISHIANNGLDAKGGAKGGGGNTHFPYKDSYNYIRGNTIMDHFDTFQLGSATFTKDDFTTLRDMLDVRSRTTGPNRLCKRRLCKRWWTPGTAYKATQPKTP